MKIMGLSLVLLLALVCILAGCRKKPAAAQVTIREATWNVEVADSSKERFAGLSGRTHLADDEGMLFMYPAERVLNFCMRDCVIPLDIVFIDGRSQVVSMETMAVEPDLAGRKVYRSAAPAQYALELPAGAMQQAGVQIGDKVTFSPGVPPAAKAEAGP